ncbi:hypothetical protein KEM48_001714 [Puccinia striiformis f. sp. tritici PST-130]|nr:hypothetical protein KEM48_001714 [Puccinia striiformis f. sp. tritici PST-130]
MALQFAIEECCRACGGHGFSQASALGALYENYLAQVTLGGRQSHDLSLNKQVLGNPNEKSTVKNSGDSQDFQAFIWANGHRAAFLVAQATQKRDIEQRTWSSLLVDIYRCTISF